MVSLCTLHSRLLYNCLGYVLVWFFKNFSEALGKFVRRTMHLVLIYSLFWLESGVHRLWVTNPFPVRKPCAKLRPICHQDPVCPLDLPATEIHK